MSNSIAGDDEVDRINELTEGPSVRRAWPRSGLVREITMMSPEGDFRMSATHTHEPDSLTIRLGRPQSQSYHNP